MKKFTTITLLFLLGMILSACQILKGDPNRPGYQEGRTSAFAYVATEDIQPEEMNAAIKTAYAVLKASILEDGAWAVDPVVQTKIANMWPNASPEFHATMFNFYSMAKTRLINEIDAHPDIPSPEVVKNFVEGVEDSLKTWKAGYGETETP